MIILSDYKVFSLGKDYDRPESNQDAWNQDLKCNTFALSDGASQSFSPRKWAEKLAYSFVLYKMLSISDLRDVQEQYIHSFDTSKWSNIQWKAFSRSSFATIIGLIVAHYEEEAFIQGIGDSAVIILDDTYACDIFPIDFDYDFDRPPAILCSDDSKNFIDGKHLLSNRSTSKIVKLRNYSKPCFLMLTDQLAAWTVQDLDERIGCLMRIQDQREFEKFAKNEVHSQFNRRDDLTMIKIVYERV